MTPMPTGIGSITDERAIKPGYCHCGCGGKTKLAPQTDTKVGWVKDEPLRYIFNHHRRKSPVEYIVNLETGCWDWKMRKSTAGYGLLTRGGRTLQAHRVLYERHVGPIPDGLEIDHLCRNRGCVNPSHLEAVTRSTNLRRGLRGYAKLTREAVRHIRQLLAENYEQREIAALYGVTPSCISKVNRGVSWGDVE